MNKEKQKPERYDVFLSYCHKDTDIVTHIAHSLLAKGLNIFIDKWELKLGDVLLKEIEKSLELSKSGVIFFSKSALESNWLQQEYNHMASMAIQDSTFRLIPIRLDNCSLPASEYVNGN